MREFDSKKGQDGNNVKTKATSTLIKHVIQFWSRDTQIREILIISKICKTKVGYNFKLNMISTPNPKH